MPTGAASETASDVVRAACSTPSRLPPPVVELAVSVGPNWPTRRATLTPSTTPRTPPSTPWVRDSPATWRTTSRCVQPSALSVPSSRTRLPTEESASSAASRNAATAATIESARPRLCERLAASTSEPLIRAGDLLRARDLGLRVRRLDALLDGADRGAVVGAHQHDVDEVLLVGELLELRERQVDVDALAAERRVDEPDDRERRAVQIELRADLQRLARRVGRGDERLAAALQEAARAHLGGRDEPHARIAELHAADRVRLALDVGLRRVEHLLQRLARRRDRLAEAPHPLGEAPGERAAAAPDPDGALLVAEACARSRALRLRRTLDAELRRGTPRSPSARPRSAARSPG